MSTSSVILLDILVTSLGIIQVLLLPLEPRTRLCLVSAILGASLLVLANLLPSGWFAR